jgi:hypothetical protein
VGDIMRGFWNDTEGLSLYEFIALWVMVAWALVMVAVAIIALCLFLGDKEISGFWLQYLDMFCDVPIAVVIGLYGQNAFGKFSEGLTGLKQVRQEQKHEPTIGEGGDLNADRD